MKTLAILTLSAASACAQDGFQPAPANSPIRVDLRPSVETVVWSGDTPTPADLARTDTSFLAPRLTLDVDASAGDHWFLHTTTRFDRGFDPGDQPDGDVRLDEIILRWRVCDDQRLNFQIGKFPTVFGAWPNTHGFFDDPFLLAPLPYSQIIGFSGGGGGPGPGGPSGPEPGGPAGLPGAGKDQWSSLIWGPVYTSGACVFGATESLDYALEIKNTGLAANPDSWSDLDYSHPAVSARFGYRPDAAWAFGLSASQGPWLDENVPHGDRDDLLQNTLGVDARWAHHNLIVSGEVVLTEFETPAADDLRAASWFLQARWKVSPGFWLATRFGQILTNDAADDVVWQPDLWRAEIGTGWRLSPNLLLKAGYSYTHADGGGDAANHLLGTGIGWRF